MLKLNIKSSLLITGIALIGFASCKKKEIEPEPSGSGTKPAIVLDCDYFHVDRVLVNDPDAPVDYIINCKMDVYADIVIEPGVVIEFEQNAGIDIDDFNIPKASLSAIGTQDKPIVFRGVKKEAGYWRGLMFDSNSSRNELTHVRVEDAGGQAFNSNGDRGGVIVFADAKLKMNNSKVTNSQTYGLNAVYNGTNSLVLNNNTISGNNRPAYISANLIHSLNGTNHFSGNTEDYILIYTNADYITSSTTWHKTDVKYRTDGSFDVNAMLTIEPGVEIEFSQGGYMKIGETGGIKAIGTPSDPIVFTGVSKVSKAWKGIYIDSENAENEIAHAEFNYSGIGSPEGNVWLWYDRFLNIHDVAFNTIHGCGIHYKVMNGETNNPNLTIGQNITVDAGGCVSTVWN
ncbi:MAG TPA: hypothetical protein VFD77_03245 [Brumimicrobium sp.]|nr:hypothetical protein [Brumimicrobium sp.]